MSEERCRRCSEMHRRLQKAEGEVLRLRKKLEARPLDTWASPERQSEAVDRDLMAGAIDRAAQERAKRLMGER